VLSARDKKYAELLRYFSGEALYFIIIVKLSGFALCQAILSLRLSPAGATLRKVD
jgi:hypothetical protein